MTPQHSLLTNIFPNDTISEFSKILARYELFKKVIDLPGDIVEAGVHRGAGLFCWAKLIQIFNPLSKRRVVGFDTFEGFPVSSKHEHDRNGSQAANKYNRNAESISPERMISIAESLGIGHRIELIKGDASVTIEEYIQKNPGFRVALLNLDFDIYEPTAAALKHIFPLVVPRGVIAFDEYAVRGWGESDAVDEYFRESHCVYNAVPWASGPKAFLVKEA